MASNSLIEWCMATWNFLVGCTKKSERDSKGELNWTGRINFDEDTLAMPLKMRLPQRIFVNSLSDLFHPNVKNEWIMAAFAVMMATPQHTYQILTKHPDRAARWFRAVDVIADQQGLTPRELIEEAGLKFVEACHLQADMSDAWPLPNVHILTSVEDQPTADERIPWLLKIPAAARGISAEPLLAPINVERWLCSCPEKCQQNGGSLTCSTDGYLDWVIVGGESGPGARPMRPDWARLLRDQCVVAGVPFFFKQWGDWRPAEFADDWIRECEPKNVKDYGDDQPPVIRVGKKSAGRVLDGRQWGEYPGEAVL